MNLFRRHSNLHRGMTALCLFGWLLIGEGVLPALCGWLGGLESRHQTFLTAGTNGAGVLILSHADTTTTEETEAPALVRCTRGAKEVDHCFSLSWLDASQRRQDQVLAVVTSPHAEMALADGFLSGWMTRRAQIRPVLRIGFPVHPMSAGVLVQASHRVLRC